MSDKRKSQSPVSYTVQIMIGDSTFNMTTPVLQFAEASYYEAQMAMKAQPTTPNAPHIRMVKLWCGPVVIRKSQFGEKAWLPFRKTISQKDI